MPRGIYGRLAAKSEFAWKHSVIMLGGVIDPDYRGELFAIVHVLGDKDWKVKPGEDVVQLILEKAAILKTKEVPYSALSCTERGTRGFGSAKTLKKKARKRLK